MGFNKAAKCPVRGTLQRIKPCKDKVPWGPKPLPYKIGSKPTAKQNGEQKCPAYLSVVSKGFPVPLPIVPTTLRIKFRFSLIISPPWFPNLGEAGGRSVIITLARLPNDNRQRRDGRSGSEPIIQESSAIPSKNFTFRLRSALSI
jgi:hypothetical protein